MDLFTQAVYDRHGFGTRKEEYQWLSDFFTAIQKYQYHADGHHTAVDMATGVLEKIVEYLQVPGDESLRSQLIGYSITSIKHLSTHTDICAGHLGNHRGEGSNVSFDKEKLQGFKQLISSCPYIILGILTQKPSSAKILSNCGSLFLEDNFYFINVELIQPDVKCLKQLVLVPRWTYVPSRQHGGYLEAPDGCIPIFPTAECPSPVQNIVSLTDVAQMTSEMKRHIHLQGRITAISPVHSFSSSKPFFLVQLTCPDTSMMSSIVVQGAHHMYKQQFIHIGKEYVITSLRQTTMNKGRKDERKVLAATSCSEFLVAGHVDTAGTNVPQSEEDNSKRQRIADERDKSSTESCKVQPCVATKIKDTRGLPTISYTGVVTDHVFPEAGVYELDNRIKLYINHQPCSRLSRGIRVGARISLYNVHLCKEGKNVLGLCCCTLSCVRVTEFSNLASPWKPFSPTSSALALHGQQLTLSEYAQFLRLCRQLRLKFNSLCRSTKVPNAGSPQIERSVIEHLVHMSPSLRNIYKEFLDVPHSCHPARIRTTAIPNVLSVRELLHACQQAMDTLSTPEERSAEEWRYQIIKSTDIQTDLIMVGCIKSSNGSLVLFDQSGDVPVHVTGSTRGGTPWGCVDTLWLVDCMVKLTVFWVATEWFQPIESGHTPEGTISRTYILAPVESVHVLMRKVTASQPKQANSQTDVKSNNTDNGVLLRKTETKEIDDECMLGNKQTKNVQHPSQLDNGDHIRKPPQADTQDITRGEGDRRETSTIDKPSLEGEARGISNVDNPTREGEARECIKVVFLVRHRENLQLRKSKTKSGSSNLQYAGAVDVKILALHSQKSKTPLQNHEGVSACTLSGFAVKRKSAVLLLRGESVRWHIHLREGCLYVLTEVVKEHRSSAVDYHGSSAVQDRGSSVILKGMRSLGQTAAVDITCDMRIEAISLADINGISEKGQNTLARMRLGTHTSDQSYSGPATFAGTGKGTSVQDQGSSARKNQGHLSKQPQDSHEDPTKESEVLQAIRKAVTEYEKHDQVYSVFEILSCKETERNSLDTRKEPSVEQVSFRGRVMCRELRLSDTTTEASCDGQLRLHRLGLIHEATARKLGLGFCYLGNRSLFLRVEDLDSPNTMDVYINISLAPYVDGVLPGAIVQCRRFLRNLSRSGNVYCSFAPCSSLILEQGAPVRTEVNHCTEPSTTSVPSSTSNVPHRQLIEFIRSQELGSRRLHTVSRLRCTITAVQKVTLTWLCLRCGKGVLRDECIAGCTTGGFRFSAEARCVIEDGTAEAQLLLSDDSVTSLLKLSSNELSRLQSHVMESGELVYQRHLFPFTSADEKEVCAWSRQAKGKRLLNEHCCSSLVNRLVAVLCKHIQPQAPRDFESRNITVNHTERTTLVRPRLLLKGLELSDVTYLDEIRRELTRIGTWTETSS